MVWWLRCGCDSGDNGSCDYFDNDEDDADGEQEGKVKMEGGRAVRERKEITKGKKVIKRIIKEEKKE